MLTFKRGSVVRPTSVGNCAYLEQPIITMCDWSVFNCSQWITDYREFYSFIHVYHIWSAQELSVWFGKYKLREFFRSLVGKSSFYGEGGKQIRQIIVDRSNSSKAWFQSQIQWIPWLSSFRLYQIYQVNRLYCRKSQFLQQSGVKLRGCSFFLNLPNQWTIGDRLFGKWSGIWSLKMRCHLAVQEGEVYQKLKIFSVKARVIHLQIQTHRRQLTPTNFLVLILEITMNRVSMGPCPKSRLKPLYPILKEYIVLLSFSRHLPHLFIIYQGQVWWVWPPHPPQFVRIWLKHVYSCQSKQELVGSRFSPRHRTQTQDHLKWTWTK